MAMSTTERASIAAHARAASQTPEQRKAAARKAYFTGAINTIVNRSHELSPEQVTKLRAVLCPAT